MSLTISFWFFESIYLKHLNSLKSERKYELSILNKMWQHVFISGSQIIYIHIFFSYVPGLYIFLLLCGNYPLILKRGKCRSLMWVDSLLNKIDPRMIELNQHEHEWYIPPNTERDTRTKLGILLGEVFQ